MKTLTINTATPYQLHIGTDLLNSSHLTDLCRPLANSFVIVTDHTVLPLYAEKLKRFFEKQSLTTHLIAIPSGETYKTRESKSYIEDSMFELGCGRDTCIIALGGGVVCDLAGFVAATFCRGIPAVYCPTTLLAMVDACIGGKTGLNTVHGKNLIGTFTQPKAVYSDLDTLNTLSEEDYLTGFTEVIKHALIASDAHFNLLMEQCEAIKAKNTDVLSDIILNSCKIKKEIVEKDESEKGIRQLLNFGHTIGHALETVTDYTLSHGHAVAIGIIIICYMSKNMGLLSDADFKKIEGLFSTLKLAQEISHSNLTKQSIMNAIALDKKAKNNIPQFVLLKSIGQACISEHGYSQPIESEILNQGLDYLFTHFVSNSC